MGVCVGGKSFPVSPIIKILIKLHPLSNITIATKNRVLHVEKVGRHGWPSGRDMLWKIV